MVSQIDDAKIKKDLAEFLEKIHTEADPELLNAYRSLIRQKVSWFKRSYLSAYLLMLVEGQQPRTRGRHGRSNVPGENRDEIHFPLAEEDSKRLFINIGRNRKISPRELLGLINSRTALPRGDIGSIRILDNYSFIQVRSNAADKIIEALNGLSFRGRTLAVAYARPRKDEGFAEEHEPALSGGERPVEENEPGRSDREEFAALSQEEDYHTDKEDIDR